MTYIPGREGTDAQRDAEQYHADIAQENFDRFGHLTDSPLTLEQEREQLIAYFKSTGAVELSPGVWGRR